MAIHPQSPRLTRFASHVRTRPFEVVAWLVIAVVVVCAIGADVIAPWHYSEPDYTARLQSPNAEHWFGTDNLGRDAFSRVIYGARTSMVASSIAVLLSAIAGTSIGMLSGYIGGKFDIIVQRISDSLLPIPLLLMAMVMVIALGSGLINVAIALGIVGTMRANRIMRGATMAVKVAPFVEAATSLGCTQTRVLSRHILPNVMAPLIVLCTTTFAQFILAEAALSFLGLGVPPPTPSWGGLLSGEGRALFQQAPWLGIAPGVAISITVLAVNILGDALRDTLDPRLRGSR